MSDKVYSITEIVGSSKTSIEDAIATAIAKTSESKRNLDWFEMVGVRGHIEGGAVAHFQVTLKVGFTLDD